MHRAAGLNGEKDSPPPLRPGMRAAIDEAYRVFGAYQVSRPINVCACCCGPEQARALELTPLRQLPAQLLAEYSNSAHGYEPRDADTLRAFLPRYFELMALNDPPSFSGHLAYCLPRLALAQHRQTWPADQIETIDRCFDALLLNLLQDVRTSPDGAFMMREAEDLLAMISNAGGDIPRVLRAWEGADDPVAAAVHIAALANDVDKGDRGFYLDCALMNSMEDAELIGDWVFDKRSLARLESAIFASADPRLQKIASDGHALIATWL